MAGPKDLFKRALSKVGGQPPRPASGPGWQGDAAAAKAQSEAPAPAAKKTPPPLREDALIAQIEAEPEARKPAPASSGSDTPRVPPTSPGNGAARQAPPAAAAAPAAGPRTAKDAAAAMAARIAARRTMPSSTTPGTPSGVSKDPSAAERAAQGAAPARPVASPPMPPQPSAPANPPSAPAATAPAPAPAAAAAPPAADAPANRVPFQTLSPIATTERRGGVAATFVPAAGPIPFAQIGAFRWLVTQSYGAGLAPSAASNGTGNGVRPAAAPPAASPVAPPPAPPAAASTPARDAAVPSASASRAAPAPAPAAPRADTATGPVFDIGDLDGTELSVDVEVMPSDAPDESGEEAADPKAFVISDEELEGGTLDATADEFLGQLSGVFADLTPSKDQAKAVAALADPLEGATDTDGDGIVSLSDVLEPGEPIEEISVEVEAQPAPAVPSASTTPTPAAPAASAPAPAPAPVATSASAATPAPASSTTPPSTPAPAPPPPATSASTPAPTPSPSTTSASPPPTAAPASAPAAAAPADVLRDTIQALGAQVRERDDIAKIVLRYGTARYRRAALFVIKKEMLVGWEGGGESMNRNTVRGIMVPLTNPSIFKTVFETKVLYCGGVPRTTVNDIFFNALGDPRPDRVIVVPFVLRDKVACVLYADGGDIEDENPGSIAELYQLGRAVSGAFENLILRTKRGG